VNLFYEVSEIMTIIKLVIRSIFDIGVKKRLKKYNY